MEEYQNSSSHNTFSANNRYTIDDVGNIGISQGKSLFNTAEIGNNTDTDSILSITENRDLLFNNVEYLDQYVIGNNIIKILGQPIPIFSAKN